MVFIWEITSAATHSATELCIPIPSFIALTTRSLPRSTWLNISGSHYPTSLAGVPILAILSVRPTPPWASSDATYVAVLRSSKRQPTSVWWDRSWSTQPPSGPPTCLKTSTPYKESRGKLTDLWKTISDVSAALPPCYTTWAGRTLKIEEGTFD